MSLKTIEAIRTKYRGQKAYLAMMPRLYVSIGGLDESAIKNSFAKSKRDKRGAILNFLDPMTSKDMVVMSAGKGAKFTPIALSGPLVKAFKIHKKTNFGFFTYETHNAKRIQVYYDGNKITGKDLIPCIFVK